MKHFEEANAQTGQTKCYFKCPIIRAGSKGRRNTCAQFTHWSLKAQSFSRALI
jgi:hypothetical protein